MNEVYLPVVGWEGLYEVSNLGRVRSLPRRGVKTLRVLKPGFDVHGYLFVALCRDGKPQSLKVHKLVAEAFIGPRPEGYDTCHGPLGKLVNTPENLSYKTHSQNMLDCVRDGTHQHGERGSGARLTSEQVAQIRGMEGSKTQQQVAEIFGVSRTNIHKIWKGKSWRLSASS